MQDENTTEPSAPESSSVPQQNPLEVDIQPVSTEGVPDAPNPEPAEGGEAEPAPTPDGTPNPQPAEGTQVEPGPVTGEPQSDEGQEDSQ